MDSMFFRRRPQGQWSAPQHLGEGDAPHVPPGVGVCWWRGSRRQGSLVASSLPDTDHHCSLMCLLEGEGTVHPPWPSPPDRAPGSMADLRGAGDRRWPRGTSPAPPTPETGLWASHLTAPATSPQVWMNEESVRTAPWSSLGWGNPEANSIAAPIPSGSATIHLNPQ